MASIKRNFLYNIVLNVSSVLFPLVTAPYIARVLDPDGVGLANFASTYASYYALFAALGVTYYGVREVSKLREEHEKREIFISEIVSITTINTVILSIIFLITILVFGKFQQNFIIYFIAGFSIYLVPLNINWYFSGMEKFGFITSRNLIIRCISIICLFLFVKEKTDLYIYMILNVLSGIGGVVWNISEIHREKIKIHFTIRGLTKHYKPLLILFSSSVAISIYTMLDTVMLGFMSNYAEVGYYNSATHVSKVLVTVITSLSAVAVPRVAYYLKNNNYDKINELMSKSLGIISFLAIPLTIGVMCISSTFVPLFFGVKFEGAIYPLMIMSCIITALGFNNLMGVQILIGVGLDKYFLRCVLIGTITNFILNLILIPILGATGASIASVTAESFILVATIICVKKYTEIKFKDGAKNIWNSLLSSLFILPTTLIMHVFLSGWYFIIISIILNIIIYIIIQYILKSTSLYLVLNSLKSLKK